LTGSGLSLRKDEGRRTGVLEMWSGSAFVLSGLPPSLSSSGGTRRRDVVLENLKLVSGQPRTGKLGTDPIA
jgi:hypothetical protein